MSSSTGLVDVALVCRDGSGQLLASPCADGWVLPSMPSVPDVEAREQARMMLESIAAPGAQLTGQPLRVRSQRPGAPAREVLWFAASVSGPSGALDVRAVDVDVLQFTVAGHAVLAPTARQVLAELR